MLSILTAALALTATVYGHAETAEAEKFQMETLRRIAAHSKRSLASCANSPAAVALRARAVARRAAWADELRVQNGLKTHAERRGAKELEKYLTLSHDESYKGYNLSTPLEVIFGSNASCILVPQTIVGPYYVEGEYFRRNITDGEPGVASHLDFQFIDINTCAPVSDLIIDLWHANSTGVYSGVTAKGQGGLKTNFGRGIQKTDEDGVVQFSTIFPGHYTGRTNHFHVMSTEDALILPNGTFRGGTVSHIGQTYFDQSLIAAVEKNAPYTLNKQPFKDNSKDRWVGDHATADYDPFMKYTRLGDDVKDGLLLWITVGIDTTTNYNGKVTVASHWHPGGGTDEGGRPKSEEKKDGY
ncbi:extracellular dioxygenase [Pochonia chlamydosporia 170]|uniref:Extracellular dioxygenase n=1 Tax=Pochonia chlamydosporia 170 TaxID=1380566 RepID=A0A179F6P5_METCM|nr:extracellular dioxygenase [Pochonia chlamydosporia 170]OAQ61011.2 extracellular dioxygenase [Pochonia chlamydosporia 170]